MAGDVEPLTVEDVLGSLLEGGQQRVIVPKKGKLFEDDGSCRIAVIRPCVSRGRRLRGLPPIYTPEMLTEHARIFAGWPMFVDHKIQEAALEIAKRTGRLAERSVWDLGGRIIESWWDPTIKLPDDEEYGYREGAVVGRAIPQKAIREMLETDPDILHCSINAWPTGAKPGERWGQKGMLVEGIRRKPPGSVDWVIRGGAGGRVLQEDEDLAVSLLESFYDAANPEEQMKTDYSKMNLDQLREHLQTEAPDLYRQLAPDPPKPPASSGGLTEADVSRLLQEQETRLRESFEETLEERASDLETLVEEKAQALVDGRDGARVFAKIAHKAIDDAKDLTPGWKADLKARYDVLPSGPTQALLVEAAGEKSQEDVLREAVEADIKHARERIAESRGGPAVRGLGRSTADPDGTNGKNPTKVKVDKHNSFNGFLAESGDNVDELVNGKAKVEG